VFLFLSGRRDGAFRVIPVTSDSGLLVSRSLRLALKSYYSQACSGLQSYYFISYHSCRGSSNKINKFDNHTTTQHKIIIIILIIRIKQLQTGLVETTINNQQEQNQIKRTATENNQVV